MAKLSPARLAFLGSAATVSGLALHSALLGAPAWPLLSGLSVGWCVLSTAGVFLPWLQMYGEVSCRGPTGGSEIALTFDDGPHPVTTRRVLSALAGTRHRATFFVLGEKVRRFPDVVREIHAAGHCLGVHGDTHDRLHSFRPPNRVRDELGRAQSAVAAACGLKPHLFRPPLGHTSPTTLLGARRAGMAVVGWSARGYDGVRRSTGEGIWRRLAPGLCEGGIVLLHDAAERDDFEPASLPLLPRLLSLLDQRRLVSVGLDRWLR